MGVFVAGHREPYAQFRQGETFEGTPRSRLRNRQIRFELERELGVRAGGVRSSARPGSTTELRHQTLNFELEMPQMAQTDPVRHRANALAIFVRFAPGTNGDRQTEFCLAGDHGISWNITLHCLCARVRVSATGNFPGDGSKFRRPKPKPSKESRIPKSELEQKCKAQPARRPLSGVRNRPSTFFRGLRPSELALCLAWQACNETVTTSPLIRCVNAAKLRAGFAPGG